MKRLNKPNESGIIEIDFDGNWKSHSTLTPLGKQDYSLWP